MSSTLLVVLAVASVAVCNPTLSVVVGTPNSPGFIDGFGTAARLYYPVDMKGHGHPQGNIHIGDRSNGALRYLDISTNHLTTRYTGTSVSAVSNMDPNGNVYFGEDAGTKRIFKITSGGAVTVIGSYPWYQYGMFFNAVDGYLYSAGYSVYQILKVNVINGAYSVYAGGAQGQNSNNVYRTNAQYSYTFSAGMTANGDFYFTQFVAYCANKIDYVTGMSTLIAGIPNSAGYNGDGTATTHLLNTAYGLDVSCDGHVYISDSSNNRIRRVTAGIMYTVAGTGGGSTVDGPALSSTVNFPWGISAHVAGKVYFLEYSGFVVRLLTEQPHTSSCLYVNYCCQSVYSECASLHASCNAIDLTAVQAACSAGSDPTICAIYNSATTLKSICNTMASNCDALISGC